VYFVTMKRPSPAVIIRFEAKVGWANEQLGEMVQSLSGKTCKANDSKGGNSHPLSYTHASSNLGKSNQTLRDRLWNTRGTTYLLGLRMPSLVTASSELYFADVCAVQTTLNMAELSRDNQLLFLSRDPNRRCRLKQKGRLLKGDVYFVTRKRPSPVVVIRF